MLLLIFSWLIPFVLFILKLSVLKCFYLLLIILLVVMLIIIVKVRGVTIRVGVGPTFANGLIIVTNRCWFDCNSRSRPLRLLCRGHPNRLSSNCTQVLGRTHKVLELEYAKNHSSSFLSPNWQSTRTRHKLCLNEQHTDIVLERAR